MVAGRLTTSQESGILGVGSDVEGVDAGAGKGESVVVVRQVGEPVQG